MKPVQLNVENERKIFFSIIIPARDEADNIALCLRSILNNIYPTDSFEIIVIDDYSQDETAEIVSNFTVQYPHVRLLKMSEILPEAKGLNAYKKKAIKLAIEQAKGEYIIATDADCTVGRKWLGSYNAFLQKNHLSFVAGPVRFENEGTAISIFQCLDFLSLQGITAASVSAGSLSMCNGANLCYEKKVFEQVGGFKGVDNMASGDDMFLMYKIQRQFPGTTGYLFSPDTIVQTRPMPTVQTFIQQRIRWASKADKFQDKRVFAVLLLIYLLNLCLFIMPFIALLYSGVWWQYWVILLAVKVVSELFIMIPIARFYSQIALLNYFPLVEPLHILYTVAAGFLGKFGKYKWKGRMVK